MYMFNRNVQPDSDWKYTTTLPFFKSLVG